MLGRHEVELVAVKHAVEILSAQVTELTGQLQSLHSAQSFPQPRYLPEPRINNPPCYSGQPTECRAFLTQCEVIFSLQPTTYAEDRSKVAFMLSLLTGRAHDWGAAVWEYEAGCCELFSSAFKEEMIKIFDRSVYGHEAFRQLVTLRQGRRSATDYAIEFRTLAATCEWNEQALTARFLEGLSLGRSRRRFSHVIRLLVWTNWSSWPFVSTNALSCAVAHATPHPSYGWFHLLSLSPQWWGVFASPLLNVSATSRGGLCMYCGAQGHFAARCPVKERAHQ